MKELMPLYIEVMNHLICTPKRQCLYPNATGRAAATGQRIAIKKIKVGEFKDGLDMSAVREVQYLRELSHPNVIKVSRCKLRFSGINCSIYLLDSS